MSRELKLRGQCKANKEWVFGSLDWEEDEDGYKRWYIHTGADGGFEEHYRVIPETVGQYTGLKSDNGNGRELFEGDSVYLAGYGDYICEFPFIELYSAAAEGDIEYYRGNIHENPELLER